VEAIEKYVSKMSPENAGRWFVWPLRVLAGLAVVVSGVATVIEAIAASNINDPDSIGYTLGWLFGGGLGLLALWAISDSTQSSIRKAMAAAEFLPDDGTTGWDRWQQNWWRRARFAGGGITRRWNPGSTDRQATRGWIASSSRHAPSSRGSPGTCARRTAASIPPG